MKDVSIGRGSSATSVLGATILRDCFILEYYVITSWDLSYSKGFTARLVKGDLNQLKKAVFDTPLKKLTGEYNDPKRVTTAKRRNEIKTLLENRKSFMNYLTSVVGSEIKLTSKSTYGTVAFDF